MDTVQRKAIAGRIATLRKERGWSQAGLAKEAGVSENTILNIETGKVAPHPKTLRKVLDALGVPEPEDGDLVLTGMPGDVEAFLRVAAKRLANLENPAERAQVIANLYRALLDEIA